jgi:hypothetical protein
VLYENSAPSPHYKRPETIKAEQEVGCQGLH